MKNSIYLTNCSVYGTQEQYNKKRKRIREQNIFRLIINFKFTQKPTLIGTITHSHTSSVKINTSTLCVSVKQSMNQTHKKIRNDRAQLGYSFELFFRIAQRTQRIFSLTFSHTSLCYSICALIFNSFLLLLLCCCCCHFNARIIFFFSSHSRLYLYCNTFAREHRWWWWRQQRQLFCCCILKLKIHICEV